jgi:hypothetical protein
MFVAALVVSQKFLEEAPVSLRAWSALLNLPVADLVKAESILLQGIRHRIYVSSHDYTCFAREALMQH